MKALMILLILLPGLACEPSGGKDAEVRMSWKCIDFPYKKGSDIRYLYGIPWKYV